MKSVLLIAHGSRKSQQNDMLFDIVDMVRDLIGNEYYVDGALMSFSDMNIEFKLKELIDKGATEINIVPYLLFSGNHVLNTIPNVVDKFMINYNDVEIIYKNSLGIDKRLAEIVVDRIKE